MAPIDKSLVLGPWRPDNADFGAGTLQIARGCIKKADGYQPARKLISVSDTALPNFADARNLFIGDDITADQTFRTWAATGTAIYEASGSPLIWTDVSKVGGYATMTEDRWSVAQFGGNVFATNLANEVQFVSVSSGGTWADVGATGIPKAKYLAVVRDFLVLGDIDDPVDGRVSNRYQWSPFRDPFGDWTDIATQSDKAEIQDLGEITGVTGGEFGTILCRNGVGKLIYTGQSPLFWQQDTVSREIGCDYPASVIRVGQITYFLSRAGWHAFDGFQVVDIGSEWVDNWTFDELRAGQEFRIYPGWDRDAEVIRWLFAGQGSQNNVPNRCLILKPDLGKQGWTYQDVDAYVLGQFVTPGFNIDTMDATYPTLDADLPPLDSVFWQAGNPIAGAIDTAGKPATFEGGPDDAQWDWAEGQFAPAALRSKILASLPITTGGAPTVQIGLREQLNSGVSFGAAKIPEVDGSIPHRDEARYVTMRMLQSGEWESATGLQVSGVTTGSRG